MKSFLVLVLLSALIQADDLGSFFETYKSGDVKSSCEYGRKLYRSNIREEKILLAIGDMCAKADYIDFVAELQQRLGQSPQSREAAVYISTIVLQKRLISQYLHENIDISSYSLPKTDHILSTVFEAVKNREYNLIDENPKHIQILKDDQLIDVSISEKIMIDVYKDKELIQRHRYRS